MSTPALDQARNLLRQGRLPEATTAFEAWCALHPEDAEAWNQLGMLNGMQQHYAEAERCCRRALQLQPGYTEAHGNLGLALAHQGRMDEAVASYRRTLELNPNNPGVHNSIGQLLAGHGLNNEAMECFQKSLALQPEQVDVHLRLAHLLTACERLPNAVTHFRAAVALAPDLLDAQMNLAGALHMLGHMDEAIAVYQTLLQRKPDWAEAHMYLGLALNSHGQIKAAIDCYRTSLRLKPDFAEALNYLGVALMRRGAIDESVECFRAALRINPEYADAYNNLGGALGNQGDAKEALACHRRALALKPDFVDAHSSILFMQHFQPDHDPAGAAEEYKNWNRVHAEPFKALIKTHRNDRTPERRLRVGYVSNDFREHVTNYFFEPVLAAHDPDQVEIFCYDTNVQPDTVTERLKTHAHHWRTIVGMSDEQAAESIRRDVIDILVDLKGHTGHHRLPVFAQKPAPLQVTWLGYPNTTGLATMDYWITDRHIADDAMSAQYHSEKLLRLPDFYMCFQPKPGAPEAGPLPALANGFISFGSFNTLSKINAETIAVWSEILRAVPGSRLMLAAVPEGRAQAALRERFAAAGIDADRLLLKPRVAHDEFLRLHREVDIALDTFPCNGTTTTLHDLWMGLPVIALAGKFHAARVGVSILANLGLPELIAHTPAEYVEIATRLADDTPRLNEMRASLRASMSASPLMDAARFTRNLETAYREIWREWCARKAQ